MGNASWKPRECKLTNWIIFFLFIPSIGRKHPACINRCKLLKKIRFVSLCIAWGKAFEVDFMSIDFIDLFYFFTITKQPQKGVSVSTLSGWIFQIRIFSGFPLKVKEDIDDFYNRLPPTPILFAPIFSLYLLVFTHF